jgi:hypothetical protein
MPTTPQDHKKPAAQTEAEGVDTVDLTWRHLTLTIPASVEEWDVEAVEAFEDGKAAPALRAILGPKQWAAFKAEKPKTRDMAEVSDAVAEAMGFEAAGN